jgi:hypothetical protein
LIERFVVFKFPVGAESTLASGLDANDLSGVTEGLLIGFDGSLRRL